MLDLEHTLTVPGMVEGLISHIQRFSIHDGPGIRTTVFLKGCPLGCAWCSNPETVSPKPEILFSKNRCMHCGLCLNACPTGAIEAVRGDSGPGTRALCRGCGECATTCPANALQLSGKVMSAQAVMEQVTKDIAFYRRSGGGLTMSGGEPFLQPDFLNAVFKRCAAVGIHTAVDTSGHAPWTAIERSIDLIDLFLFDVKHINAAAHTQGTTVSNDLILQNLKNLLKLNKNVMLRLPLIPGFNDTEENLEQTGVFASQAGVKEIRILPYHNYGRGKYEKIGKKYQLDELTAMDEGDARQAQRILGKYVKNVSIGG